MLACTLPAKHLSAVIHILWSTIISQQCRKEPDPYLIPDTMKTLKNTTATSLHAHAHTHTVYIFIMKTGENEDAHQRERQQERERLKNVWASCGTANTTFTAAQRDVKTKHTPYGRSNNTFFFFFCHSALSAFELFLNKPTKTLVGHDSWKLFYHLDEKCPSYKYGVWFF